MIRSHNNRLTLIPGSRRLVPVVRLAKHSPDPATLTPSYSPTQFRWNRNASMDCAVKNSPNRL